MAGARAPSTLRRRFTLAPSLNRGRAKRRLARASRANDAGMTPTPSPGPGPILVLIALAGAAPGADAWPQFRGPTGQGWAEATGLPLHWSEHEHVLWRTA